MKDFFLAGHTILKNLEAPPKRRHSFSDTPNDSVIPQTLNRKPIAPLMRSVSMIAGRINAELPSSTGETTQKSPTSQDDEHARASSISSPPRKRARVALNNHQKESSTSTDETYLQTQNNVQGSTEKYLFPGNKVGGGEETVKSSASIGILPRKLIDSPILSLVTLIISIKTSLTNKISTFIFCRKYVEFKELIFRTKHLAQLIIKRVCHTSIQSK